MHQKAEKPICETLLGLGDEKETLIIVWVQAWPLLGREDRIAAECTGDEKLPVL